MMTLLLLNVLDSAIRSNTILMDYLLQRECTLCRRLCRPRRRQDERLPHHGHQAAVLGGALRQSLNASEFSSGYPTAYDTVTVS